MRNRGCYTLLFIILTFYACKKTRLEGDLSVLIGTWEWKNTVLDDNLCDPSFIGSAITHSPTIDGHTYTLKFIEKGKLEIIINNKINRKARLIRSIDTQNNSDTVYNFYLNRKKNENYVGFIYKKKSNVEYIYTYYFPQDILSGFDGCKFEYSIFEKTN